MVTGDHARTALSVAHRCGILPVGRSVFIVDAEDGPPATALLMLSVITSDGHSGPASRTQMLKSVSEVCTRAGFEIVRLWAFG